MTKFLKSKLSFNETVFDELFKKDRADRLKSGERLYLSRPTATDIIQRIITNLNNQTGEIRFKHAVQAVMRAKFTHENKVSDAYLCFALEYFQRVPGILSK